MRVARLAVWTVLSACTTEPTDDSVVDDDRGFEFEPGVFIPKEPLGKADLPNGAFSPRGLDTSGYRAIAKRFLDAGYDLRPTFERAAYDWPLADSLTVLSREGTPIRLGSQVYEHTGLDIIRASEMESATVHAPTTGTALITDWLGQNTFPWGDYSTVVSIWDPSTHHLIEIMHIKPDPMLPREGFFEVQRGQVIGELAHIDIPGGKHTHVNVIDAEHFELIDPIAVMPAYADTTTPTIGESYLLDAMAAKSTELADGPIDVIVTAHDRDDNSLRNLEISSIAFVAKDQDGVELARLPRCYLKDAFKKLVHDWNTSASTIRLIDFGNATGQFHGFWPSSDLGNPDRLFRYAITNLKIDNEGKCSVVDNDRDGQIEVAATTTKLELTVDVWDGRGNKETTTVTFARPEVPPPPPPQP